MAHGPRGVVIGDVWRAPSPVPPVPQPVPVDWRKWRIDAVGLVPVALVAFAAWTSCDHWDEAGLTIHTCRATTSFGWISGYVTAFAVLVWSLSPARFRGPRRWVAFLAVAGVAAGTCGGIVGSAWRHHTPVLTAPDGSAWFAWWTWDSEVQLHRVADRSLISVTGEEVARSEYHGEFRLFLPPGDGPESQPWLHIRLGPQGEVVVGSGSSGACAYVTRDGGYATSSPFLLLGPADRGTEENVAEIESAIRDARDGHAAYAVVVPEERGLLDALRSPNPWVVETARRFIRAGGETLYPEATKRL